MTLRFLLITFVGRAKGRLFVGIKLKRLKCDSYFLSIAFACLFREAQSILHANHTVALESRNIWRQGGEEWVQSEAKRIILLYVQDR